MLNSLAIGQTDNPSLREKIGQMLMVGFNPNSEFRDTLLTDLSERNLGGVILFGYNVSAPSQLEILTEELKGYAETPPFIAIDQEGGVIARLDERNGYEETYTALELGSKFGSKDSTRAQAAQMAGWLKDGGINMNLAPVVDLNVYPQSPAIGAYERAFSDAPDTVAKHAGWFIDESHKQNIMTALKHFPGHGSARDDSHLGFTDITETWADSELIPYQTLFEDGYSDLVMPGHLFNAELDSTYPATLSQNITTEMLRNQLGFKGVVISDGMFMNAISENYGFFEAVELAINAGVDILLYSANSYEDLSLVRQIVDFVENRVIEGSIAEETIDSSYASIMKLKQKYLNITDLNNEKDKLNIPGEFKLSNYPNPFNPTTTITFNLPARNHTILKVYNTLGELVTELVNEELSAGRYEFKFNAGNLSSGVYIYHLRSGNHNLTEKMMLVR